MSELKAKLSGVLATVRAGGSVTVTDRGRPVVRVEPATPADDPAGYAAGLVASGLATAPAAPLSDEFFDAGAVKANKTPLSPGP